MKKRGFTLAEILITLGIIGVVSAIVIPQFTSNAYDQANASKLSSIVADYENVFGHMLLREDRENIFDTAFGAEYNKQNPNMTTIRDALEQYTKISRIGNLGNIGYTLSASAGFNNPLIPAAMADIPDPPPPPVIQTVRIYNINGDLINNFDNDIKFAILTPGGAVLMFEQVAEYSMSDSHAGTIYIDVNGGAAPNRLGRDIFTFLLAEDGHLYPYGSAEAGRITANDSTLSWHNNSVHHGCDDGTYDGRGCTARLIENNYRMDY